jgi:hypothetical protein
MRNNLVDKRINRGMESKPNPELFSRFSENPKFGNFYLVCEDAIRALEPYMKRRGKFNFDEDTILGIRRMMGLYSDLEEFEKCSLLKSALLRTKFPDPTPLFDYREIYG